MTQMSPALDAALTGTAATVFGAVEFAFPSRTVRLLDGSGQLTISGNTFYGQDATYGVLAQIEELSDGSGDEAPALSIVLHPAGDAAAADLCSPSLQGSSVTLWLGAVDPTTGLVIGTPMKAFGGLLDFATLKAARSTRSVEYEITSVHEDFFFSDDGIRLAGPWHKSVWPGELGLDFVSYVQRQIYWGQNDQSGVTKSHSIKGLLRSAQNNAVSN